MQNSGKGVRDTSFSILEIDAQNEHVRVLHLLMSGSLIAGVSLVKTRDTSGPPFSGRSQHPTTEPLLKEPIPGVHSYTSQLKLIRKKGVAYLSGRTAMFLATLS